MSLSWTSYEDLFARARRELFSAVIGDTLDLLGHRHQFLPPYAQDQRTRGTVVDFRCPVRIGRVDIRPGDTIFGDLDGVVVIPREIEAEFRGGVGEGPWRKARVRGHQERHKRTGGVGPLRDLLRIATVLRSPPRQVRHAF
jgi:hypothetical protein